MSELKGACIIGQSGGPTAVINASAAGVIQTALKSECITRVLGAAYGIKGVLADVLYDMGQEDPEDIELLKYTPASLLGTCRYKLADPDVDDTDYKKILEIFQKYDVRYFFYNGGNDSMDTCNKISKYMQKAGYECRVMGVPKTIDNDLYGTDHCPGFASAAKYIATTFAEVRPDACVYDAGMVSILECMGRNAGWLAGSAALANLTGYGPDLIYLPEVDFSMEQFLADVKEVYERTGNCMVAISEGIHYADGMLVAHDSGIVDSFGHTLLGGTSALLCSEVSKAFGYNTRSMEFCLMQRCAQHIASATDIDEAWRAGAFAVESAVAGVSDKMVAFKCSRDNGYQCELVLEPLEIAANIEKKIPREWINEQGNNVTQEFIDYVLPLIQGTPERPMENGMPRFAHLKKIKAGG